MLYLQELASHLKLLLLILKCITSDVMLMDSHSLAFNELLYKQMDVYLLQQDLLLD